MSSNRFTFNRSICLAKRKSALIKFKADITDSSGKFIPGIVFMRGGAVGMLVVLNKKFAVLTVQPRVPTGDFEFVELPAGMLDGSGNFAGVAAKEIEEELDLKIAAADLKSLDAVAGFAKGFFVSPGGSDETIRLFYYEAEVSDEQLAAMNGKATGLIEEGEQINLKIVPLEDLWKIPDGKTIVAYTLYKKARAAARLGGLLAYFHHSVVQHQLHQITTQKRSMNTPRMFLDVPGEGYGHSSYPYFTENDKQYLTTPRSGMVLAIVLEAAAKLESFVDGKLVHSREIAAGDQKLPLTELITLQPSEVYFQITVGGAEPVKSTVYVFIDNYTTAYQENQTRQYALRQAREERRRLAQACPPPVAPATYQDLIDEQLRLAREAAEQAGVKLTQAGNLANHAAGIEIPPDQTVEGLLDSAMRSSQDAARLIQQARTYRIYAQYYREENEAHKS